MKIYSMRAMFSMVDMRILLLSIALTQLCSTFGTEVSEKFCTFYRTSTVHKVNAMDSFYRITDTVFQFEFYENGVFVRTDKKFTEIYRQGKKNKMWHKTFRVIKGKYINKGDSIEILSGFKEAGNTLSRFYERQEVAYWARRNFTEYLWDTEKQYNYTKVSNWESNEYCQRKFRHKLNLIHERLMDRSSDTISFWRMDSVYFDFMDLPKPKFLYPGAHLYIHTYVFYNAYLWYSYVDTAQFENKHLYDSTGCLHKYYYLGNIHQTINSCYYEFKFENLKYELKVVSIRDSKDDSYYRLVRDTQGKLRMVEHYNVKGVLIERFSW